MPAATVAVGAGFAVVVARDGTPVWQAARLLAVLVAVALAWKGLSGERSVLRVFTGLALGAVAIPVGIGIGGPYLAKTGTSVLAVAGLLALAGGSVLFGVGLAGLFRAASHWIRVPACTAAVVALFVLSWSLGQAVAATNVPRPSVGSRTPADVGLTFGEVEFAAMDGVRLSGWYVPSRNGAAVVLLHGAGSTRSNVLDHAVVLAQQGFGVLLYDARGHGRSSGRAMDFGWFGDRDIGGAVTFLQGQPGVDAGRIAAVGLSMGGEQAIGAAAGNAAIRAVVAEGATNRVAGDKAWLSDDFGARGTVTEVVELMTYGFADLLTSARPPITLHEAARISPRPMLLIAAGDAPDEGRAGRYIESASPGTVDLWVAPHTSHTDALKTHPDEWENRVVTFLDGAFGLDEGGDS